MIIKKNLSKQNYRVNQQAEKEIKGDTCLVEGEANGKIFWLKKTTQPQSFPNQEFLLNRIKQQPRHPQLLKIIDLCKVKVTNFLITEYCEAGDISQLLQEVKEKKKTISSSDKWKIILDVGKQLEIIRSLGYIYDGLKPEHIVEQLIRKENGTEKIYKLCSFGYLQSLENFETTNHQLYSKYSAPETLKQEETQSQDIFSFGAIIYELIAMTDLYSGQHDQKFCSSLSMVNTLKTHQEEIHMKIDQNIQDHDLAHMLKRIIHNNPAARPTIQDLNKFIQQKYLQTQIDQYSQKISQSINFQKQEDQTIKQEKNKSQGQNQTSSQKMDEKISQYCQTLENQILFLKKLLINIEKLITPNQPEKNDWKYKKEVNNEIEKLTQQLELTQGTIIKLKSK